MSSNNIHKRLSAGWRPWRPVRPYRVACTSVLVTQYGAASLRKYLSTPYSNLCRYYPRTTKLGSLRLPGVLFFVEHRTFSNDSNA